MDMVEMGQIPAKTLSLRDWILRSRFIDSLEARISEQRKDFETRLAEKDARIRELRLELADVKAENDRMRAAEPGRIPVVNAGSAQLAAVPDGPLDWNGELAKMLKEEEDGVHGKRREEVNESRSDDGA